MSEKAQDDTQIRLPRASIDMKVPLPWLLGIAFVMAWGAISMYFNIDALKASMDEVKISVKATNAATLQVMGEQSNLKSELGLLRYRLEKLEGKEAHK